MRLPLLSLLCLLFALNAKAQTDSTHKKSGLYLLAQAGMLVNRPDYLTNAYDSQSQFQVQVAGGYKINPYLSVGGYAGINMVSRVPLFPLGIDFRTELTNKRFSPILYLQTGWAVPMRKHQDNAGWWADSMVANGGITLSTGTGFRILRKEGGESFWLSLGYLAQKSSLTTYVGESYRTTEIYNQQRWSVQMGWMFW